MHTYIKQKQTTTLTSKKNKGQTLTFVLVRQTPKKQTKKLTQTSIVRSGKSVRVPQTNKQTNNNNKTNDVLA